MKLCCHSSIFINYKLVDAMHRLAGMGYNGIEISAISECGTFTPDHINDEKLEEVAMVSKELGLSIVSYDCELLPVLGRNLVSPYDSVREKTVKYVIESISVAKKLGAEFVVIGAGMAMFGIHRKDARIWLVEKLNECVQYAEKEHITLLLEHTTMLEGNMVVTLNDLLALLDTINSKYFLPLIDTGHIFVNGESFTDYVKLLKNRIRHIHIDDNDGRSDDHLPPGKGFIDFRAFLSELSRIGYNGFLSIEPSFAFSHDPDTTAFSSLHFMKDQFIESDKRLNK